MANDHSGPEATPPPKSSLRRSGRLPLLLVLLALVAAGIWFGIRSRGPGDAPKPAEPAPAARTEPAAPEPEPEPEVVAAPADVRSQLERASSDPRWRSWLDQGDLVRKAAVVIANLVEGVSPRAELRFLAPAESFQVVRRGGVAEIAPASYARYDAFADVIASLDPQALATAWTTLRPAIRTAYRALGVGSDVDAALSRALARLEGAPVRDGPVRVVEDEGVYVFADPKLEKLSDVEKHLLRMGPRNTRIVQEKARALREAIGLPAP